MGIGDNFFTHIIIDEAAQMMEAEAYIPLCLANLKTTIILAGLSAFQFNWGCIYRFS
jgi:superfamily I DNA and/or RNA helicase